MTRPDGKRARRLGTTALSLLTALSACTSACLADAAADASKSPAAATPSAGTTTVATPSEKVLLKSEEMQLRRMGEAIKRVKRAAIDLIGECTQPIEMMGEIDIIGTDVIPIMPVTAEGFGTQYMPPRPKYVNLHMQQLGQLIPILQDDINTLTIPDDEKDYAAPLIKDLNGFMGDINQYLKTLQNLTKDSGDYSVIRITSAAQGIHSTCGSVDKSRKKLLHEDKELERKAK